MPARSATACALSRWITRASRKRSPKISTSVVVFPHSGVAFVIVAVLVDSVGGLGFGQRLGAVPAANHVTQVVIIVTRAGYGSSGSRSQRGQGASDLDLFDDLGLPLRLPVQVPHPGDGEVREPVLCHVEAPEHDRIAARHAA